MKLIECVLLVCVLVLIALLTSLRPDMREPETQSYQLEEMKAIWKEHINEQRMLCAARDGTMWTLAVQCETKALHGSEGCFILSQGAE